MAAWNRVSIAQLFANRNSRAVVFAILAFCALALLASLDRLPPVGRWNETASVWLQGPDLFWLTVVATITGWLFAGQIVILGGAIACAWLWLRGRAAEALSLSLIAPLVVAEVVLKGVLRVPNPEGVLAFRTLVAVNRVGPEFLQFGFPSGHAARAAFVIGWLVLTFAVGRHGRWWVAGAVWLVLFVCWTRIYAGDHWLLDIAGGLLLAAGFLGLGMALASVSRGRHLPLLGVWRAGERVGRVGARPRS